MNYFCTQTINLVYLKAFKEIRKHYRWVEYLEQLIVALIYIEGKHGTAADYFSRNLESIREWKVIHCSLIKLEAFNNSANYVPVNPAFIIYGEEVRKSLLRKIFMTIIYRRWSFNNKFYREETCCSWRIPSWNFKVLSHSQSLLGQLGCFKTEKSYERFWWPNLKTDVMDFISSCEVC